MIINFEDTKGVIRIRISKKSRQHNGRKKKHKRTNNDLQNIHIKLKSSNTKPTKIYTAEIMLLVSSNTNPTKNRG